VADNLKRENGNTLRGLKESTQQLNRIAQAVESTLPELSIAIARRRFHFTEDTHKSQRLAVIPFLLSDVLNPFRDHWDFG